MSITPTNTPEQDKKLLQDPAAAANAPAFEVPEQPSIGEKWWHRLTYGITGYGANLLLSLVLWDYMREGGGKPMLNKISKGFGAVFKAGGMSHSKAMQTAEVAADMAMSPLGGHVMMIPVKYLEDNAGYITHTFNKMLDPNYKYKNLSLPDNAQDSEYPPLAKPANLNTWGQIAMRRGLGWVAVTAAGVALNKSGWQEPLQNTTLRVFNRGVDVTGSSSLRRFANIPRIQRFTQLAALDAYFTLITSGITEMTKTTFGESRNGNETLPEEIDIPGITEDIRPKRPKALAQKKPAGDTYVARLGENPPKTKPLSPQENYVKTLKTDREAPTADQPVMP